MFYAHSKEGLEKDQWQLLKDHLFNTAHLAYRFGTDAGVAELAYIAGLVHDLGKYSLEFQQRLEGRKHRVDHSTAGAKVLQELLKDTPLEPFTTLLAYPITGHHGGLLDYGDPTDLQGDGTLAARLKADVNNYRAYETELDLRTLFSVFPKLNIRPLKLNFKPHPIKTYLGFSLSFAIRMIFSALVDADFQDTESFMRGSASRGQFENIDALCERLNSYLRRFDHPQTTIDQTRTDTLKACIDRAVDKPGFFKLTVPTGGGKTLASMAFALNHAASHGLRRVIYVIPYTTIIEQNAGVFKQILGEQNVLEHHANFEWEELRRVSGENPDDQTISIYSKLKLAAENWDIPVIVTTNVQFFESLFANRSSRCRKLHNIARSVIIFDEAQMLPRDYLIPAMSAVWELVTNYGASAVFCTATQPELERFFPPDTSFTELAPHPQQLFEFYKRVEVKNLGKICDQDLLDRINAHKQVLCIVNTRRHASGLFNGLDGDGNFHLSTLMCPAHRTATLASIRQSLENDLPCRVVSTTVMEAGIDLDFPVGYRALSGLDSINQAAGRVNRNMKRGICKLFIFEPVSEFAKRVPTYVSQAAEITRQVMRDYSQKPISVPAIASYFNQLYSMHDWHAFDVKDILACFDDPAIRYRFATAAKRFQVIEDISVPVIIPFNKEAIKLIDELKVSQYPLSVLRKLQPYTVSIYQNEFDALSKRGVILTIADTYAVLNPVEYESYYDPRRGLLLPTGGGGDGLFF